MTSHEELFALAIKLKGTAEGVDSDGIAKPLRDLEDAVRTVARSFSGSWQGYHSRVYYAELSPPPPGAHFSQEWGLMHTYASSLGSRGDWREYDAEGVKAHIRELARNPNLEMAHAAAKTASETFETAQSEMISILQSELEGQIDGFLENLKKELEALHPMSPHDVAQHLSPNSLLKFSREPPTGRMTSLKLSPRDVFDARCRYQPAKTIHHQHRIRFCPQGSSPARPEAAD